MPEESRDTRRGIQNVQQRVSGIPSRETVGDRHLRGGKWGPKAANDAEIIQAANDAYAYAAALAVEEDNERETQQQSHIQQAIQAKAKKVLLKKTLTKKTFVSRQFLRATWGFAFGASMLQIVFAIGAALGFGGHVFALYARHETIIGRLLGVVIDFQNYLPFEPIGYVFWGMGLVLSCVFLFGYLFFFPFIGVSILHSSTTPLITCVCFALNIVPFINIIPWLLIWFIYMSLFSSIE